MNRKSSTFISDFINSIANNQLIIINYKLMQSQLKVC